MAEQKDKPASDAPQQPRTIGLGVRLVPAGDSDQPRVAKEGGKLPESINGRLATRVAMSYDTLANLQQQLSSALQGMKAPAKP